MPELIAIPGGPARRADVARSVDLLLREHIEPAVSELRTAVAGQSIEEVRAVAYELVVLGGLLLAECRRAGGRPGPAPH